jgi:hypothetical protein
MTNHPNRSKQLRWQPIETAPRDGTPILAYNGMVGVYNTAFTTWFDSDENLMRKPGYEGFPCGFWSTGLNGYPFGRWDCQPSHWMPLPAPPPPSE